LRRTEGFDKVTGRTVYTEDMALANLAHAKLVLSYVPSATIRAVEAAAARAVPGVLAVVTGEQLDAGEDGPGAPLTRHRVYFAGQPVAAVVAETPAAAADAASLVEVEYEPRPAFLDVAEAASSGVPTVLPEASTERDEASLHGAAGAETAGVPPPVGNITAHVDLHRGDVAAGLAAAAAVVRQSFKLARVHQGFLEPHAVTAAVERDGTVTVWSPTQGMSEVRKGVAASLGVAGSRVRVVPLPVGGGFGGKIMQFEPLAAHLARACGRPVRLQLTRSDEFLAGWPAPSSEISVELGADGTGDLAALRAEIDFDNGAGGGWHAGIVAELLVSTYRLASFQARGREVATNKLPVTAYRAPGAPQAYFALESALDELARELGRDPIELRLHNASRQGDPRGDGSPWPAIGFTDCLEAARRHPVYTDPKTDGEGVGVAAGSWIGGFGPAAAACRVEPDGTLSLHLGTSDISGSDTGFAVLAAETFGTSPERVRILRTDSDTSPVSPIAGGSATTYSVAPAVAGAALEVRRQVLELAAAHLEAAAEDLELSDGQVSVKGAAFRSVSLAEVAQLADQAGGPGPIHAIGRAAVGGPAPMFTVHIARVRVDRETGLIRVHRYAAIQDVGRAINRPEIEGQIHGGVLQSLGRVFGEEIVHDGSGQQRTASFLDYLVPTIELAPEIDVELIEVPSDGGAGGARGVGEPPVIPVLAAVANAIRDATGTRVTSAPFGLEALALMR
jgi:CO/xanthine dehydrogenase Mo-binding subunit